MCTHSLYPICEIFLTLKGPVLFVRFPAHNMMIAIARCNGYNPRDHSSRTSYLLRFKRQIKQTQLRANNQYRTTSLTFPTSQTYKAPNQSPDLCVVDKFLYKILRRGFGRQRPHYLLAYIQNSVHVEGFHYLDSWLFFFFFLFSRREN